MTTWVAISVIGLVGSARLRVARTAGPESDFWLLIERACWVAAVTGAAGLAIALVRG